MNNKRRNQIEKLVEKFTLLKVELSSIADEERCVAEALEDKWSGTNKYEVSLEAANLLEYANDNLESLIDNLNETLGLL